MDTSSISDLIVHLRKGEKTDKEIIDILESMIRQHMMYGGVLQDKINYWMDIIKID
jgi:hypothetical protein